ncbi:MAG: hypothetical protein KDA60_02745 [Planctomycetales bacterium]|nr:hypothetical protein [Planctomycetales bacterium]
MAANFDPYHKWLAIPPTERPINHYRLLGVPLFESDLDVIANAADRQMMHVKSFATGPHGAESQRLLNKLSRARVCLTNSEQKAKYDAELVKTIGVHHAPVTVPARPLPVASAVPAESSSRPPEVPIFSDDSVASRIQQRTSRRRRSWLGALAVIACLGLLASAIPFLLPGPEVSSQSVVLPDSGTPDDAFAVADGQPVSDTNPDESGTYEQDGVADDQTATDADNSTDESSTPTVDQVNGSTSQDAGQNQSNDDPSTLPAIRQVLQQIRANELDQAQQTLHNLAANYTTDAVPPRVKTAQAIFADVQLFWRAVGDSLKTLSPGTELVEGQEPLAVVVSVTETNLVLQHAGRRGEYPLREQADVVVVEHLPPVLGALLAERSRGRVRRDVLVSCVSYLQLHAPAYRETISRQRELARSIDPQVIAEQIRPRYNLIRLVTSSRSAEPNFANDINHALAMLGQQSPADSESKGDLSSFGRANSPNQNDISLPPTQQQDKITVFTFAEPLGAPDLIQVIPVGGTAESRWRIRQVAEAEFILSESTGGVAELTDVAVWTFNRDQLQFRWLASASEGSADEMAFSVMKLRHGEQTHVLPLSGADECPAVVMDFEQDRQTIYLPYPEGIPEELLTVRIDGLTLGGTPMVVDPIDGRVTLGKALRLSFVDSENFLIQCMLRKTNSQLELQIRPGFRIPTARSVLPFTISGFNERYEKIKQALASDQQELNEQRARINQLTNDIRTVSGRTISPNSITAQAEALQKQQQLADLQGQVNRAQRRIGAIEKDLSRNGPWLEEMATLSSRVAAATGQARLDYSVNSEWDWEGEPLRMVWARSNLETDTPALSLAEGSVSPLPTSPGPPRTLSALADQPRLPVPGSEAIEKEQLLVNSLYRDRLSQARSGYLKRQLALQMLRDAASMTDNPVRRYVIFQSVLQLAVELGDATFSLDVIRQVRSEYDVEEWSQKAEALGSIAELAATRRIPYTQQQFTQLGVQVAEAIEGCCRAGYPEPAPRLLVVLQQLASGTVDPNLQQRAAQLAREIPDVTRRYDNFLRAEKRLRGNENDKKARRNVGEYLCLYQSAWEKGLEHLAQLDEAPLSELARRDLAGPDRVNEQISLGDAWWEWSEKQGAQAGRWQRRAADWYRKALPSTSGLERSKLTGRIAEAERAP